jgi:hypothetical protein
MLNAKCIRSLGSDPVHVENCVLVIIEDSYGNPIAVVAEVQPDITTVVTADDPDFNRILNGLGINKIVVANQIDLDHEPMGDGAKLLSGPAGFEI